MKLKKLVKVDSSWRWTSYHNVVFNAIFFKPEQEVIDGEVIEIAEFGAFVRIGPMDGLVHVSQVTDDYINYDSKKEEHSLQKNLIKL